MATWIDLLASFAPLICLLGEVYLGKRVYDATRRRSLLHQKMAQIRILASRASRFQEETHLSKSSCQASSGAPSRNLGLLLMFREQLPAFPNVVWEQLSFVVVVTSIFVLAYSGTSLLLRPFANRALLAVLPVCLPLTMVPLPYLLSMKPRATLLVLVVALGSGFLTLVLMGV